MEETEGNKGIEASFTSQPGLHQATSLCQTLFSACIYFNGGQQPQGKNMSLQPFSEPKMSWRESLMQ